MINNVDQSLSIETQTNINLISNVVVKHYILFGMAIPPHNWYSFTDLGDEIVI